LHDGVRREALEETGLEVEPGEVLEVFDSIFTDGLGRTQYHYVLIDYLCRVIGGDARPGSDVSQVKWVSKQDLSGLGLRESIERVVRKGISHLG
jgi:8-oxo-dGTP diphosphatase